MSPRADEPQRHDGGGHDHRPAAQIAPPTATAASVTTPSTAAGLQASQPVEPLSWPLQGQLLQADAPATLRQGMRWSGMTADDLPAVLAIERAAYSHPWTPRNLQDAMGAGNLAQLLWQGDALVGYFVAMPGVDEVHLLNITVAPQRQGQGIARLLLGVLALWATQLGKPWIWLEVRRSNARALHVYQRYGFEQVGLRKAYYPDTRTTREDAIVMSLGLPAPASTPPISAPAALAVPDAPDVSAVPSHAPGKPPENRPANPPSHLPKEPS